MSAALLPVNTLLDDIAALLVTLPWLDADHIDTAGDLAILARHEQPGWTVILTEGDSRYVSKEICGPRGRPGAGTHSVQLLLAIPLGPALDDRDAWSQQCRDRLSELIRLLTGNRLLDNRRRPVPPTVRGGRARLVRLEGALTRLYTLREYVIEAEEW